MAKIILEVDCVNQIDQNQSGGRLIVEEERVILVNEQDEVIGFGDKIETHLNGDLHRAFSVFIFNSRGELLLQKRSATKYHSKSLWSNACCGHPRPGESIGASAHRRLKEEMGFSCELKEIFSFTYRVKLDNNFFENEYDHVFVGSFDGEPVPNPHEVDDWKWIDLMTLKKDLEENLPDYTYWLSVSLDKLIVRLGAQSATSV